MSTAKRVVIPFIIIAALGLGGCANQMDRKQATEDKARNVSGDVWATQNQIDATMVAMNNLLSADGPQLQQAFDHYSDEVDRLKKQATIVNEDGDYLRKQSESYLTKWQQQTNDIQNADLRNNSEQGRKTVRDRFTRAQDAYNQARTSLDRLIRNFEDIRTALRNDRTTRGVQAVARTDVVPTTEETADEVKAALRQVRTDSTALAEALSSSAPPLASSENTQDTNQSSDTYK